MRPLNKTTSRSCALPGGSSAGPINVLPPFGALQAQLGRGRLVGEVHHDAACRAERNDIRLIAAAGGCRLSARATPTGNASVEADPLSAKLAK